MSRSDNGRTGHTRKAEKLEKPSTRVQGVEFQSARTGNQMNRTAAKEADTQSMTPEKGGAARETRQAVFENDRASEF